MIDQLIRIITSMFLIIPEKKAISMNLDFVRNVYGDEINMLNCRSIWKDQTNRDFRIRELHEHSWVIKINFDHSVSNICEICKIKENHHG